LSDGKDAVRRFWDEASCGEKLYLAGPNREEYANQATARYKLEPYIARFAEFDKAGGKRVLEVGVGLGADHQRFAEAGAILWGIDLTERAIEHTRARFSMFRLNSNLQVADAEHLPFEDGSFDFVYSWGVIHHSPNTSLAVREIVRVLRPGGEARVMIYHKWSLVGLMLWIRYALLRAQPFTSLRTIYASHLESPGTKAYSIAEARKLFSAFAEVRIETVLTHADLLTSPAGQRHSGRTLETAKFVWPRRLLRRLAPRSGLFMLVTATKRSAIGTHRI
jgi:SAM-dependent methyltransferase